MHTSDIEGFNFTVYQLKGESYQWYNKWEDLRAEMLNLRDGMSFLMLFLIISFLGNLGKQGLSNL